MIETEFRRFGLLKAKLVYFADKLPVTSGYHFVYCNNCYRELSYAPPFQREQRHTLLFDLTQDRDNLFGKVNKKRRNIIRRGLKMDFQLIAQEPASEVLQEFQVLYNKFVPSKGAGKLFSLEHLVALEGYITVFSGKYREKTLIMKIVIHDGQTARDLFIVRNEEESDHQLSYYVGSALQWETLMYFKERGYNNFDAGGLDLDPGSPTYGVNQYKMSFGGEVVPTYYYEAAVSPMARAALWGRNFVKRLQKR